jgi:hypothetical protein
MCVTEIKKHVELKAMGQDKHADVTLNQSEDDPAQAGGVLEPGINYTSSACKGRWGYLPRTDIVRPTWPIMSLASPIWATKGQCEDSVARG